ncbi:MAG: VF530 family protein [Reichenbachiella sp.]
MKRNENAPEEQKNNPLHGIKLTEILDYLVELYGWEQLSQRVRINCFKNNPTIKSSLEFLRRIQWAREEVEQLYLKSLNGKTKHFSDRIAKK